MTVENLIRLAMVDIVVGRELLPVEVAEALSALNQLIAEWTRPNA